MLQRSRSMNGGAMPARNEGQTPARTARARRAAALLVAAGLTAAASALAMATSSATGATAKSPAADCQPFGATPCLFPFPNNLFTVRDRTSATGLRVHLPAAAMPTSDRGQPVNPAPYDRNDGFSPGSAIVLHVPGLDNPTALAKTGAVGLLNMSKAFAANQPIVVIDEATGRRQLIYSELDANTSIPQDTNLMIVPGKEFIDGHTYVVALRDLRNSSGRAIAAPGWFEKLRDGKPLPRRERSQTGRYTKVFAALKRAGINRSNLYEAWDFTVASRRSLTGRLLSIRDQAFAQLGDTNLADGTPQGSAPQFSVTDTSALTGNLNKIDGTFQVPCYLNTCGPTAETGFHYSSSSPDATPTQIPNHVATAQR